MQNFIAVAIAIALGAAGASAQAPRVEYTVQVDSTGFSGISVDMRIHGAPSVFRVAMVAHTEYDDQYWRYLTGLRGESIRGAVRVIREDSSRWRVEGATGDVTLHYRVRFPVSTPLLQAAWQAHITPTGGLIGGPHSFLYVIGAEASPVRVNVELPSAWRIVTALDSVPGRHAFAAASVEALVDSPILIGEMRTWRFAIEGVPHTIAYLGHPGGAQFDTVRFMGDVERIARETVRMFESMPYRRYSFLFEDAAAGGLEHASSVTMGTQSANLATDPSSMLQQIAHEFYHTWNEVHLRPVSWIGVRSVAPEPTGELWWSEGVTIYYANLMLQRAGLPMPDSTRIARLQRLIGNYYANPSHSEVSPEATSRAFNKPAAATGDYTPNMFTQGELLGNLLDMMIRSGSGGVRTLDDAMRTLSSRFSIERGFTGADVERAVREACTCEVKAFFDAYVHHAGMPDFERALSLIGLQHVVTWTAALMPDGSVAPDLRLWVNEAPGQPLTLRMWFPSTLWGRAGLHTGDRLIAMNGAAVSDVAQFRQIIGSVHTGDSVRISIERDGARLEKTVVVTGYDRPVVRLQLRPDATAAQRRFFAEWKAGQ